MSGRQIPFYRPEFGLEQRQDIARAIDAMLVSGQLMMGPWKDKLEQRFRDLTSCRHAVSLNSATTALQITLQHFNVRQREVLVPAASFLTDVSAVTFAGGTPVLVDVDTSTLSLDLADLERRITPATKGVIWVHLTGLMTPDWQKLRAITKRHGLFLIEDASHAHGASIDGQPAGSLGDAGVFSFYPTKVVTAGTGGILTTNDTALASYAEEMRIFGKDKGGEIRHLGNDWFLDEIRACVGFHHASTLEEQLSRRRSIAQRYYDRLANLPGLRLVDLPTGSLPSWYHFPTFLDASIDRDATIRSMAADGVQTKLIYRPVHREHVFKHLDDGTFKQTEYALDHSLCLPLFVGLADDDVDYVCDRLRVHLQEAWQAR